MLPERTIEVRRSQLIELLEAARTAAASAYAPYSRFRVGAAVLMDDDPRSQPIIGTNVENNSYGLSQCAERSALQSAVSRGFRRLRFLAVSCLDAAAAAPLSARSPCGACRQVIREFAGPETLILIDRGTPVPTADAFDIDRLLPFGFRFSPPTA